ncbi:MAG: hypothetical protein ACLVJO_02190 [[Clostridium] scindens]
MSIIYISHRLDEIFELSDRVTVMRDGQMIKTAEIQDITKNRRSLTWWDANLPRPIRSVIPNMGILLEVKAYAGLPTRRHPSA